MSSPIRIPLQSICVEPETETPPPSYQEVMDYRSRTAIIIRLTDDATETTPYNEIQKAVGFIFTMLLLLILLLIYVYKN